MIGLFSQAQFRGYKLTSNKESGLGRFDIKIEPTEKAINKTSVILEIKIVKKMERRIMITMKCCANFRTRLKRD